MKIYFLIILGFCLTQTIAFGQKASQKTVDETCGCVKAIDPSKSADDKLNEAIMCMTASMVKNLDQLKKEYKIKNPDQQEAAREVGSNLGAKLVKDCPEMTPYFLQIAAKQKGQMEQNPEIDPDTLTLDKTICKNFKTGKYNSDKIFVNKKTVENPDATSYTEIKDGFVYDYSENKKYVTKWSVRWIDDCKWEQTLIESNEPSINSTFKKGDKITMNAIGSTKDGGLWISSQMMGMDFIVLLKKIK